MDFAIVREKLDQAAALLAAQDLDAWITFVRETPLTRDPCLDLTAGLDMTWQSAFVIHRSGERVAVVGRFDADNVRATGGYHQVAAYDEDFRPALRAVIERLAPRTIALNYSPSDPAADGLTHGLWLALVETFAGTPYAERFVSAEGLVAALRGRKSPEELARLTRAIRTTERLFARLTDTLRPGQTEQQVANRMHAWRRALSLAPAWDEPYCPAVNAGPDSAAGHGMPGRHKTARGQLLHLDFGVRQDGFCSDLQRTWYFLERGERRAPDDVRRAWDACWSAVLSGADALRPGVAGWQVDAAARTAFTAAGFPEYQHALGHQLGRTVHDGAALLGPRWKRYGSTPEGVVEAGNVFTLELGVFVPERGTIGLEEDVGVTEAGIVWLSKPQRKLWLI